MAKNKIALFGNFRGNNLGNNGTLAAILFHLRQRHEDSDAIVCISTPGSHVPSVHRVDVVDMDLLPVRWFARIRPRRLRRWLTTAVRIATEPLRWHRTIKVCRGLEHLVIAGTGVLDDFGQGPFDFPLNLWRWCRAAKKSSVRLSFVSIGAGPIKNAISRCEMKQAVRLADFASYRDDASRNYMKDVGCDTSTHLLASDLAFSYPMRAVQNLRPANWPPKTVGIGVMGYYGWNQRARTGQKIYESYLTTMASFVASLLKDNYAVRFIIGEVETDDVAVRDILELLASGSQRANLSKIARRPIASFDELLQEILQTDVIVATRYHNILCSLLLGRPAVSIGYNWKNDALMNAMNLSAFCQRIEELDEVRLNAQFHALAKNPREIIDSITQRNAEYRAQLDDQYDRLFGSPIS